MLACTYYANGQIIKAVALLEQVVEMERAALAETHPDLLDSQHDLALAYEANGQIQEAVALLEQVVEIRRAALVEDYPSRLARSTHLLLRTIRMGKSRRLLRCSSRSSRSKRRRSQRRTRAG
jgi:tetratricopeptide (TPR) repeat protein